MDHSLGFCTALRDFSKIKLDKGLANIKRKNLLKNIRHLQNRKNKKKSYNSPIPAIEERP